MKLLKYKSFLVLILAGFLLFPACDVEDYENLDNPTIESILEGATLADLKLLASGLESVTRSDMQFYYWTVSSVGRDYYDMNNTDPRYTGELLGRNGSQLDNNGFLTTRSFSAPYRVIRNANTLITAVENSAAGISVEEENSFLGFANTLKAHAYLLTLNHQYQNGCRLDVNDPDALGPFVSYEDGLRGVRDLLSTAQTQLNSASDEFLFQMNMGFSTPSDFAKVAAALAARTALYQGNLPDVNTDLANSFMDIAGDMSTGAYHTFGIAGGDFRNPLFYVAEQDFYMAGNDWVANIEAGDSRASKVLELASPITTDDITATHQVQVYASDTDPIALIRNEELLLMHAEANLDGATNATAIADIDAVRLAAGLGAYGGGTSDADVMDEILQQRRYGLFGEGHRWVDLRRLGRLGDIVVDRAGDVVHEQFPRPVSEGE